MFFDQKKVKKPKKIFDIGERGFRKTTGISRNFSINAKIPRVFYWRKKTKKIFGHFGLKRLGQKSFSDTANFFQLRKFGGLGFFEEKFKKQKNILDILGDWSLKNHVRGTFCKLMPILPKGCDFCPNEKVKTKNFFGHIGGGCVEKLLWSANFVN